MPILTKFLIDSKILISQSMLNNKRAYSQLKSNPKVEIKHSANSTSGQDIHSERSFKLRKQDFTHNTQDSNKFERSELGEHHNISQSHRVNNDIQSFPPELAISQTYVCPMTQMKVIISKHHDKTRLTSDRKQDSDRDQLTDKTSTENFNDWLSETSSKVTEKFESSFLKNIRHIKVSCSLLTLGSNWSKV